VQPVVADAAQRRMNFSTQTASSRHTELQPEMVWCSSGLPLCIQAEAANLVEEWSSLLLHTLSGV
jgi:hypothetical protein